MIHESTGYPVAVAFNAGNLELVARTLHTKFPDAKIIICADDDVKTDGNPGLTKATAVALAVGGLLAIPDFGAERPGSATDFNDMAALRGVEDVARNIAAAKTIQPTPVEIVYRRFSDVKAKPIRWLWPGRIAVILGLASHS